MLVLYVEPAILRKVVYGFEELYMDISLVFVFLFIYAFSFCFVYIRQFAFIKGD